MIFSDDQIQCKNTHNILLLFIVLLLSSCGNFVGFDGIGEPDTGSTVKIRLYMSDKGIEKLYNSVADDDYAHALYRDIKYACDSWIKIRGDISRAYPKKSFTLKFEKPGYDEKYALSASFKDPSLIRNRLAMAAYRYMGLASPAVEGAALFINDSYIGYYTKLELYSEVELKKEYGNLELFKCKFDSMGNDFPLHWLSEKQFPDKADFSSLNILISCAKYMNESEWNSFVQNNFDIEKTARYLFIHNFLAVTDTVQKNFNIVYNGKYSFLPWDNEANMGRTYTGAETSTSDYPFAGNNMLTKRLLQEGSPVREQYIELFKDDLLISALVFFLKAEIAKYKNEIENAVRYDRNKFHKYSEFLDEVSPGGYLEEFLSRRAGERPYWLASP